MEKLCKYCGKVYPEEMFERANIINGKEYRRNKCEKCRYVVKKKRRKNIANFMLSIKKDLKCSICGIDDYRVMDFHHKAPKGGKEFCVSNFGINGWGKERILKEIKKCIAVCANCHRIIHYNQIHNIKDEKE